MSKKNPNDKQVFDISKPGSTKPSDNSKNIIIKSSGLLQDPMVVGGDASSGLDEVPSSDNIQGAPPLALSMSKKLNLQPLDKELEDKVLKDETKTELPLNAEISDQTDSSQDFLNNSDEQPISGNDTDSKTEAIIPEEVILNDSEVDPSSEVQEDLNQDSKDNLKSLISNSIEADPRESLGDKKQVNDTSSNKEQQLADQAELKKRQELNELILTKKFFLPINKTQKKKNKQILIIGLILAIVLIVFWIDIALDAGIIHISGIKPFTHFFSN